jgi:phage antirepressor YoqD-like protein
VSAELVTAAAARIDTVPFEGSTFLVALVDGEPLILVRRICEALRVDVRTQRRKLERAAWARTSKVLVTSEAGRVRASLAIDLPTLPLFLASISKERVGLPALPNLVAIQRGLPDAIRDRFFGPREPIGRADDLEALLERALDAERDRKALAARVCALEPKAAVADRIAASEGLHPIGGAAKAIGTGPNRLFAFLRRERFLMPDGLPFQIHVDSGRAIVRQFTFTDPGGKSRTSRRTMLTGRGLAFVTALWQARGDADDVRLRVAP